MGISTLLGTGDSGGPLTYINDSFPNPVDPLISTQGTAAISNNQMVWYSAAGSISGSFKPVGSETWAADLEVTTNITLKKTIAGALVTPNAAYNMWFRTRADQADAYNVAPQIEWDTNGKLITWYYSISRPGQYFVATPIIHASSLAAFNDNMITGATFTQRVRFKGARIQVWLNEFVAIDVTDNNASPLVNKGFIQWQTDHDSISFGAVNSIKVTGV